MSERILIIDFGSQVTQLIARRVRESGVFSEIYSFNTVTTDDINNFEPSGVILSGGPASLTETLSPRAPDGLFKLDIPVLGICYGQMAMAEALGGKVISSNHREFGRAIIEVIDDCELFNNVWRVGSSQEVWMSHGDHIKELPPGFRSVAKSKGAPFATIVDDEQRFYGLMFHPEVIHTPHGRQLLKNFTHRICGCQGNWSMAGFKEQEIKKIREEVGTNKVICGLSGGVDSTVVAVLLHEAIGKQLQCVFVDTGLMRNNEAKEVVSLFKDHFDIPLIHRDATELFVKKLEGETDPESKRKIIGATFVDVFEDEANKIGGVFFLAQGTLYPDVIESVSFTGGPSVTIKSHHNVGGLPQRLNMKLVEPLRALFKDEVRKLGRELGLPEKFVERHPFPGPGLAIRIPGNVTKEKIDILRNADKIYLDEIEKAGLYENIWQAFAVLLPVQTVGVMGDARTYDFVCALRAVTSTDGMTADFYHFDLKLLAKISNRIINEVPGINRVTYDITSKPPGTIEWE